MLLKVTNNLLPILRNNIKLCCVRLSTSTNKDQEEQIKIGKWNINYLKVGNGPHKILCMPGALGSIWTDFKPQVEGLNKDKFTVVAWDPPGYGKSRPPERDFPPELYENEAQWAYEFMKALNIPKYSLLGWSDGGISSMILAARHPEVVNKLVVWGSNVMILPTELAMYKKIKDISTWSKRMREPMINIYGEELFSKYWAAWVEGMEGLYNAKDGNICSEVLKDIKCPTFILYGEKDPIVENVHVQHLHTNIKGSSIHLYPDGKHNIHLAYSEDFNKRVEQFLCK